MKKAIAFLLVLGLGSVLCGETASTRYQGIRPDDPNGHEALVNPERGFRWENRFASPLPKWADSKWVNAVKAHAKDGLTMTQGYCELIDYAKTPEIPAEQLKLLENSFQALRENGLKVQLCFRYEMNSSQQGPTADIILAHIKQLKPLLQRNMDVIAVLQTGFIGLYGEWHRSTHKLESNPAAQEKILHALLDVMPPERKLMLRYPRHKNTFVGRTSRRKPNTPITAAEAHSLRPEARIGYCDHGFMVGNNDAGTFAPRPSEDYYYMTQESLFLPVDGELFWVWNRPYGIAKDDGLEAIKRLWEHHYTLFSFTHNHTVYESREWKDKLKARYSLDEWKDDQVTPDFLRRNALPFAEEYFQDAKGNTVSRSVFEYIRDHLGYRLALVRGAYSKQAVPGQSYRAEFAVVNHGFAAPINPRPVYLVLIDHEQTIILGQADTDVRTWYPCDPVNRKKLAPEYKLGFAVKSFPKLAPGSYKLGLWLPDSYESLRKDARYSIRFANRDVPYRDGVNIVGEITVQ